MHFIIDLFIIFKSFAVISNICYILPNGTINQIVNKALINA